MSSGDNLLSYNNIDWRMKMVEEKIVDVEKDLTKECDERKETDKQLFDKFDKMNHMIIYQLFTAILTLIIIIFAK